jgi:hypothetical protein
MKRTKGFSMSVVQEEEKIRLIIGSSRLSGKAMTNLTNLL